MAFLHDAPPVIGNMQIRTARPSELNHELLAAWSAIQQAEPSLDSPFFRPEFAMAMDSVRRDVFVGILEEAGQPLGFFPYHRAKSRCAAPLGLQLSGFEGVIAPADFVFDVSQLIRGCGLLAWRFDHLPSSQRAFEPYVLLRAESPWVDLSGGLDVYSRNLSKTASHQLSETQRRIRRLTRELTAPRFEMNSRDPAIVDLLIRWKDEQCRRTGVASVFELPWVEPLLKRMLEPTDDDFRAMMSVAYFGDRVAAIHYGLRSGGVLHSMFPVYDPEFARHSPGLMLYYELIDKGESLGLKRMDMGKGYAAYKTKLANGSCAVAEGTVDFRFVRAALWRGWLRTRNWLRSSPLRKPAHRVNQVLSKIRNWFGRPS